LKDDDLDSDNDGVKDVKELSGSELMARKFKLVLRKMNPEKVDDALASLYKVWLSVVAVLSIQFARTIALALTIADCLEKPTNRFVAPVVKLAIPKDYGKWVPVVLSWITKSIAMSFAFYVQSIVSAAASALSGGLFMARSLYNFWVEHRLFSFGMIAPENHEDTYIDEILSYAFAGTGFYMQFRSGFSLPSPLNWILWPFQLAEYYIRWSITRKASGTVPP